MSELSTEAIILLFIFLTIFSNWFSGFIQVHFFTPKYDIKESLDYLAVYGLTLKKLILSTDSYKVQSNILKDSRSTIRKMYSARSLHILIVYSNSEKDTKVIWVELIKSWNILSSKTRRINYFIETNPKIKTYLDLK